MTDTKKKNPRMLKPLPGLSESARRNLQLERCAPRVRAPGEATPIVICNSTMPKHDHYRTGDGESRQHVRAGAMRALEIASAGFPT